MRLTLKAYGKHFGELGPHIRGIVYYKLSAHEQKPFANAISQGIPNFVTRTRATIFRWLPMFIGGYLVYYLIELRHWQLSRKNPNDYMHEVDPAPPKVCKRVFEPPPKCKRNIPEPEIDLTDICDDEEDAPK